MGLYAIIGVMYIELYSYMLIRDFSNSNSNSRFLELVSVVAVRPLDQMALKQSIIQIIRQMTFKT